MNPACLLDTSELRAAAQRRRSRARLRRLALVASAAALALTAGLGLGCLCALAGLPLIPVILAILLWAAWLWRLSIT